MAALIWFLVVVAAAFFFIRRRRRQTSWKESLLVSLRAIGCFLLLLTFFVVAQIASQSTAAGREAFSRAAVILPIIAVVLIIAGHVGLSRVRRGR